MTFDPNSFEIEVFENNTPILGWIGVAVAIVFMTYLTISGVATNLAVLVLLWILVLGFVAIAFRPCVRVEIAASGVSVRERAPLWRRHRQFAAKDVSVSDIEEMDGGEGTLYGFSLLLPDVTAVDVIRGDTYQQVEQERLRLLDALTAAEQRA
jgi:hypothetical protein